MVELPAPEEVPLLAAAFGRALHGAGLPGSPERSVRFARALQLAPPVTRTRLYWTARTVFVSARDQVAAFDAVFAAVFDGARGSRRRARRPGGAAASRAPSAGRDAPSRGPRASTRRRATAAGRSAAPSGARDDGRARARGARARGQRAGAPGHEGLRRARARRAARAATAHARPRGRHADAPGTRRARRARRGERLDVRATLRASRRTGGDPVRQVRRRRVPRQRPLVVLCDISGSMEPYARAFLQFLHGAVGAARRGGLRLRHAADAPDPRAAGPPAGPRARARGRRGRAGLVGRHADRRGAGALQRPPRAAAAWRAGRSS